MENDGNQSNKAHDNDAITSNTLKETEVNKNENTKEMDMDYLLALSMEQEDIIEAVELFEDKDLIQDIENNQNPLLIDCEIITLLQSGIDTDSLIDTYPNLTKKYIVNLIEKNKEISNITKQTKNIGSNKKSKQQKKYKKRKKYDQISKEEENENEDNEQIHQFVKNMTTINKKKKKKKQNKSQKKTKKRRRRKNKNEDEKGTKSSKQNKLSQPTHSDITRSMLIVSGWMRDLDKIQRFKFLLNIIDAFYHDNSLIFMVIAKYGIYSFSLLSKNNTYSDLKRDDINNPIWHNIHGASYCLAKDDKLDKLMHTKHDTFIFRLEGSPEEDTSINNILYSFNNNRFIKLPYDPIESHQHFTSIYSKNYGLITIGGYSGIQNEGDLTLNDVNMLSFDNINNVDDVDVLKWNKLAAMTRKRSCLSALLCDIDGNEKIMVIGGFNWKCGIYGGLKHCEIYDFNKNAWTEIGEMRFGHSECGVVQWKERSGNIIAVGSAGTDYHALRELDEASIKCEEYVIEKDRWYSLPNMNKEHKHYPLVNICYQSNLFNSNNGVLVVLGNTPWDEEHYGFCEYYDPRDNVNKWQIGPKLIDMININDAEDKQYRALLCQQ